MSNLGKFSFRSSRNKRTVIMMKTKCDNLPLSSDASHFEVPIDKTPSPKHNRHKRDSGYSTDFSPSSVTGKTRHFTFDSDAGDLEFDLGDEFQNMALSNDVFTDEGRGYSVADSDEADKEVETLFSDSEGLGEDTVLSNLTEVKMFRPAAPIPSPFGTSNENNDSVRSKCGDSALHHALQQTYWDRHRLYHEAHFRPISRSPGTRTPSSQSKMIDGLADLPRPRFQPYSLCRGIDRPVKKHQSKNASLPDIVTESRDRSLSWPEMPSASQRYEQEVAQRLRRISDEFDFASQTDRMSRSPLHRTSSFTFSLDIMRYINSVRKYLSPALRNDSPEETIEQR